MVLGSKNPLRQFSRGVSIPFASWRLLLEHPSLFRFIAIPLLINLVVFSGAAYLGLDFFNESVIHQIPRGDAWYWVLIYYFLWALAVAVTAVLVFFAFTVVGNLVASPFNELLSEKVEAIIRPGGEAPPFSLKIFFREAGRTLLEESKKLGLFLLGMALLLLLNLIPVVGTILYSGLSLLFTLFFLAVEYTGYLFSRKGIPFSCQRRFIGSRSLLLMGFSTGVLAILAIPFFQFLCIPLAVIGGTRLCLEEGVETPEFPDFVSAGRSSTTAGEA